jgi:hypothetical protein
MPLVLDLKRFVFQICPRTIVLYWGGFGKGNSDWDHGFHKVSGNHNEGLFFWLEAISGVANR